jgi:DNA uptake protein ComE-like DNA-binding protein
MATYKRKKINKGLIVLNRGERAAVISLLSLIAIFLGFSLFRPVLPFGKKGPMAFHNLDSMLAAHALPDPETLKQDGTNRIGRTSKEDEKGTGSIRTSGHYEGSAEAPKSNYGKKTYASFGNQSTTAASPTSKPEPPSGSSPNNSHVKASPKVLALNAADSTELVALPQIGEVMASRIHRYRDRLGGYVSLDQLFEVKGMDTARFETIRPYLVLETNDIRHLDVNNDEFKTLLRHPYLEYDQVKAIVNYRERKGLIRDWKQLCELTRDVNPLLQHYVTY